MDMKSLGLKIGLEIHQQLDTRKLFCSCPSTLREDKPDFGVVRKLRAVAGEAGEIDIAAQVEQSRERMFRYEGYNDTTCLVELDEEPPHPMNPEALSVVLQAAKLVNATIVSEIQVMRKTIVNGSVVSGFQRTALIAIDGHIDTPSGTITIPTIMLEEDAAKEISQENNIAVFCLDRLGIPLIEISTGPDITDPQQCMEVAAYIGMLLRSTEKVKRGLGTIRQDLNVSISNGQRIEVKGVQDLKLLPLTIEYEAMRQKNLLDISSLLKKVVVGPITDITSIMHSSSSKIISDSIHNGGVVIGICVPKLKGYFGRELQPGRRLGTELSDYAKVHGGVGGIFHSDELPKYGITAEDVENVESALSCSEGDGFVLIADAPGKAKMAMDAVIARLQAISTGVPREVRRASQDGTTSYMRPMPGAARLYPETDIRPITPNVEIIKLPELWTEKAKHLQSYGLSNDLAQAVVSEGHADFLFDCIKQYPTVKPSFIAETIISVPKTLLRKCNLVIHPTAEDYHAVFEALSRKKITKDAVLEIFHAGSPASKQIPLFVMLSDKDLKAKVKELHDSMKDIPQQAISGRIIEALKTKAEVQKIQEAIRKIQKI